MNEIVERLKPKAPAVEPRGGSGRVRSRSEFHSSPTRMVSLGRSAGLDVKAFRYARRFRRLCPHPQTGARHAVSRRPVGGDEENRVGCWVGYAGLFLDPAGSGGMGRRGLLWRKA